MCEKLFHEFVAGKSSAGLARDYAPPDNSELSGRGMKADRFKFIRSQARRPRAPDSATWRLRFQENSSVLNLRVMRHYRRLFRAPGAAGRLRPSERMSAGLGLSG